MLSLSEETKRSMPALPFAPTTTHAHSHPAIFKLSKLSAPVALVPAALLATSLWALSAPSAYSARVYDQNGVSIDLYGKVQAAYVDEYTYEDLSGSSSPEDSLYSSMRLGLGLRSPITTGLDGIALAEWDTSRKANSKGDNEGTLDHTRYMFVGLDAYQYGTLIAGRGDGAYYTVVGATDIFNIMESKASDYFLVGEQRPAQIMYALHGMSWDLKLSYQFDSAHAGDGYMPVDVHQAYGAAVSTKFGENITFAYGLDYTKFDFDGSNEDIARAESFFVPSFIADGYTPAQAQAKARNEHVGAKVDYGAALSYGVMGQGLYAALVVGSTKYDYISHHLYTVDTAVSYTTSDFLAGLTVSAGYGLKSYDEELLISDLTLGISYSFNAAFKLFAEAQFDLDGNAAYFYGQEMVRELKYNEDKFALGAEFNF